MVFRNEQDALVDLAEMILDAAANLYKATKYVYSLSKSDFYHCDVKDAFKIILNNIFDSGALRALNLSMDDSQCAEMNCPEYSRVFSLLVYSFAVRLPVLRGVEVRGDKLSEQQLKAVYDYIMSKGVVNHDDAVPESYEEIRICVKKGNPVPPYQAEWYRAYLLGNVPALADLTNRNLFLFGTVEVLFVMFYLRLEQELRTHITTLCAKAE